MPRSTTDADEIAEKLRRVVSILRRRARSATAGDTVAYPQLMMLKRLEQEGPTTTADLARAERVTPQTAGSVVAKLEKDGMVARKDDAQDGRRRVVLLTAAGRKVLAESRARSQMWLSQHITDRLAADEIRVLVTAMPILEKLVDS